MLQDAAARLLRRTLGVARGAVRHGQNVALFVRRGAGSQIWKEFTDRISSTTEYVVLRCDLSEPIPTIPARIPLRFRALQAGDESVLFGLDSQDMTRADLRARLSRRHLRQQGIGRPYVAVTEDDRPVWVQWLFLPPDFDALASFSGGFFPHLGPDQAIVEAIFTVESARGQGVMTWAQCEIARAARAQGASSVLTWVATDNVASLKGVQRAGFVPWGRQWERWSLFRRRIEREMPASAAGTAAAE